MDKAHGGGRNERHNRCVIVREIPRRAARETLRLRSRDLRRGRHFYGCRFPPPEVRAGGSRAALSEGSDRGSVKSVGLSPRSNQ